MTVAFAGTWNDVVENRPAFLGAVGGTVLTCAVLVLAALLVRPSRDTAAPEPELEFHPGFIARLGIDDAIGTDPGTGTIAPETPTEPAVDAPAPSPTLEPSTPDALTDEPTIAPRPRRPRGPTPPRALPAPSADPGKLPTAGKGSPLADPDGWSDMTAAGDPWATAVMAALADMSVGAFAGDLTGQYKFQLSICSDGSIQRITNRGGNISATGRAAVRLALEQLDLPRPSAAVRRMMNGRCQKIAHVFVWSARSVK
jgi:hypothetical protein